VISVAGNTDDASDVHADDPLLLTVEEAADRLHIGRTLMYSLVSSGAVRSVTIGRLRRVPAECLEQYISVLLHNGAPGNSAA
jgi:excisionase family DNA binding protein